MSTKKARQTSIKEKLEIALADFKTGLKEKQFDQAIKRGSKLMGRLLSPQKEKKIKKKKKEKITEETTINTG